MKRMLGVSLLCLFLVGTFTAAQAEEVKLILATGGTAGTYYPFGGSMAKIWNSKIPGMNVTAQATGASAENVRLVNKKEAELATGAERYHGFRLQCQGNLQGKAYQH